MMNLREARRAVSQGGTFPAGLFDAADLLAIERGFPPGEDRPDFDIPRFWSNARLRDPEVIIALVLSKPSTADLARILVAYGPQRVLDVMTRQLRNQEMTEAQLNFVAAWLAPVMKGVADAARQLPSA